jgi:glycosyltransferase involved in cell wall biosynthesis
MASSPQFFTAVSGYMVSLVKRVPYGLEIADLWPESVRAVGAVKGSLFLDLMERVELFLYRKSDFIIALTSSIKASMVKRGIEETKISTVINGVNRDFFKTQAHKDESLEKELQIQDKFVVGYIGTLGMAHNLENVLEAAKILKDQKREDIHFLLVGGGAEKEALREFAWSENLFNVSIIQRQPKEEIPRYWSVCDLALVHLSNNETFKTVIPSKIFEAMGVGKPILYCGPESDGSQIVLKEKAGKRVDSGDPESLAKTITDLASQKETLEQMKLHSTEASHHYSRKRQAEAIIEVATAYLNDQRVEKSTTTKPQDVRS